MHFFTEMVKPEELPDENKMEFIDSSNANDSYLLSRPKSITLNNEVSTEYTDSRTGKKHLEKVIRAMTPTTIATPESVIIFIIGYPDAMFESKLTTNDLMARPFAAVNKLLNKNVASIKGNRFKHVRQYYV